MKTKYLVEPGTSLKGTLSYDYADNSFNFSHKDTTVESEKAFTLSVADTLGIIVDINTKRLQYADGYMPLESLAQVSLVLPNYKEGHVIFGGEVEDADNGITFPSPLDDTQGYYDSEQKWTCFGDPHVNHATMIASMTLVSIVDNELKAVWLKVS